jgi:hypothetical protein
MHFTCITRQRASSTQSTYRRVWRGKSIIDAGIGIYLIYAQILGAMRISLEFLKPTDCFFHRIVPGSANYPLGRITLDVCFGNRKNYRKEKLDFEVLDWPSQYHAILGRPVFSRFMEVPHYTYLVLKMPGPRGIITVKGSFEMIWARRRRWSPISGLHQDEGSSLHIGTPGRPTICNN